MLFGFVVWLCAGVQSQAQLKWDTEKVALTCATIDGSADAKFGFVNSGASTVIIDTVKASCGCLVPTLAKTSFAPAERGEIVAQYTFGDRRGSYDYTIDVGIRGQKKPITLRLAASIRDLMRITPALLEWANGEANTPKTISIQIEPNQGVSIGNVIPAKPNMSVKLESIVEGKEYRLTVIPKDTEIPGYTLLKIEASVMGKPKVYGAYTKIAP